MTCQVVIKLGNLDYDLSGSYQIWTEPGALSGPGGERGGRNVNTYANERSAGVEDRDVLHRPIADSHSGRGHRVLSAQTHGYHSVNPISKQYMCMARTRIMVECAPHCVMQQAFLQR